MRTGAIALSSTAASALTFMILIGCSPSRQGKTPDSLSRRSEIIDAQKLAADIENWRVRKDWSRVNEALSAIAYTPGQRQQTPSYPFAVPSVPPGDLASFTTISAVGLPDHLDPKTGNTYPTVEVVFLEGYSPSVGPIRMHLTMRREGDGWKLNGVTSKDARKQ